MTHFMPKSTFTFVQNPFLTTSGMAYESLGIAIFVQCSNMNSMHLCFRNDLNKINIHTVIRFKYSFDTQMGLFGIKNVIPIHS